VIRKHSWVEPKLALRFMIDDAKEFTGVRLGWCSNCAEGCGEKYPFDAFDHFQIMP
jgi:hypothetical protein